ncbi:hypothetical protein PFISCL1PPCAC_20108, partial [Pristionchus fissidentatus]
MEGVDVYSLETVISLSNASPHLRIFDREIDFYSVDSCLPLLLSSCDRFAFLKLMRRFLAKIQDRIEKMTRFDESEISKLIYIGEITHDYSILNNLFRKFCLLETLEKIEKENCYLVNGDLKEIIERRKTKITHAITKRPKLRFVFRKGEIVVSLLNDFHPIIINDLISKVDCHFIKSHRNSHNGQMGWNLWSSLRVHNTKKNPLTENEYTYLVYAEFPYRSPRLFFSSGGAIINGWWVIGVVEAGDELANQSVSGFPQLSFLFP